MIRQFLRLPRSNNPEDVLRALEVFLNSDTVVLTSQIQCNIPCDGTMNSVNTVFTVPWLIRQWDDGRPQASLWWKTGPQLWVASSTPNFGEWTIVKPVNGDEVTTIKLGQAPDSGDSLVFPFLLAR